jgi:Fur family ferric uptake transcriptional regulator
MDALNSFKKYLEKHSLKRTPERLTVLNEVLRCNKHFDPDTLFIRLKKHHKKISRATIYRTLDLLVDSGLLKKLNFTNQTSCYEINMNVRTHDHFFCLTCGKIIEMYDDALREIHQRMSSKYKIKIEDYSHQLYGKCPDCQKKDDSSNS